MSDPEQVPIWHETAEPGTVLARNACGNCRRPIELLAHLGWLHAVSGPPGKLGAHDLPMTCERPAPVDYVCRVCGRPEVRTPDGKMAFHYLPSTRRRCPGTHTPGDPPPAGPPGSAGQDGAP